MASPLLCAAGRAPRPQLILHLDAPDDAPVPGALYRGGQRRASARRTRQAGADGRVHRMRLVAAGRLLAGACSLDGVGWDLLVPKQLKEGLGSIPLRPVPLWEPRRPSRYTMRRTLETLPIAPRPMMMLTLILDRRQRSLSISMEIGMSTNVQSAITLMIP